MLLALDIGNTNIVVGCIDNGTIRCTERIRTDREATSAEYAVRLLSLLQYMKIDPALLEGGIIASVVPPVTAALQVAMKSILQRDCMIVGPGMKTGMNVLIDDPSTLGADLVVGGVAAIACYGIPSIIIDMGTATTVTVVDRSRAFRGGAILPGLRLSFSALSQETSLLPGIDIGKAGQCIGTNTVDCMRSGAVYGTAAMLDGLIDRMEAELGYPCHHIATGGLAASIIPFCSHEIIPDDDLLLKGLWVLYTKNMRN